MGNGDRMSRLAGHPAGHARRAVCWRALLEVAPEVASPAAGPHDGNKYHEHRQECHQQ
jgi:hypothetical protein